MTKNQRNTNRWEFGKSVASDQVKVQIGARGSKLGPEWLAIDLFDTSPLIDERWDLQHLPLDDGVVDCYVCNAVLEHVPDADLALYEMHRTLRVGGQLWVEVPFQQFYHGHPFDYRRWTLMGLQVSMSDFTEVRSGISGSVTALAKAHIGHMERALNSPMTPENMDLILSQMAIYDATVKNPHVYDGTHFWGRKERPVPPEKKVYQEWRRQQHCSENSGGWSYDAALKLTRAELCRRIDKLVQGPDSPVKEP